MFNFKFNENTRRLQSVENPEIPKEDLKIPGDDYKEKLSKAEDPLAVGTERYGEYTQNKELTPVDVLEDQNLDKWTDSDPEKTFVKIEDISENDTSLGNFEDEDITQNWRNKKAEEEKEIIMDSIIPTGEGLINGKTQEEIIAGNETQHESLHQDNQPIIPINIEKVSGNIEPMNLANSAKSIDDQVTLQNKEWRSMQAKNSKSNRPFKQWQDKDDYQQSA